MKIRPRASTVTAGLIVIVSVISIVISSTFNQTVSATVPGVNQLASQSTGGTTANAASSLMNHSVSGDGKYVVFTSSATNLTAEATGGVFLRDTVNQTTSMISLSDTGSPVYGSNAVISYDGRYVAFASSASNVVTGVTSGQHIYVRDLTNQTTKIADTDVNGIPSSGATEPDINADGRYLVFITSDRALTGVSSSFTASAASTQVVIKDMVSSKTRIVSGAPTWPSASGSGVSPKNFSPSIDCSGRVVAFASNATNLGVNMYQWSYGIYTATVDWDNVTYKYSGGTFSYYNQSRLQLSCNGNSLIYGDSERAVQLNRLKGTIATVSLNSAGTVSNQAQGGTTASSISDDGRYVVFTNKGTNLDSSHSTTGRSTDFDVFVRDTKTGTTNLVTFTALGNYAGRAVGSISISPDGSTVALTYKSPDPTNTAGEFITGIDTNQADIYVSKTGF